VTVDLQIIFSFWLCSDIGWIAWTV